MRLTEGTTENEDYRRYQIYPAYPQAGKGYRQVVKRCLQGKFELPSQAREGNEHFATLHLNFSILVGEQLLFPLALRAEVCRLTSRMGQ